MSLEAYEDVIQVGIERFLSAFAYPPHAPEVWLLMLCLCSANSWGDLDQVADATLKKHPTAPTARLRDTAQDYCGALWAKRRATELRSYVASWITWDPAGPASGA